MLASLAEVLRFRILLTTNFDSLSEQVFEAAGNPLTVFDVHLNAGMPAASNVLAQHSIVKLHGGRYGLRGDFSLDSPPSYEDRLNFVSYLAGRTLPELLGKAAFKNTAHLLVAGVSGSDLRITTLIDFATSVLPDLKVFWVCYSEAGLEKLKKRITRASEERPQPFYLFRHTNLGLLFLELYQRVAHCIPHTGLEFPAVWQLPTPAETPPSGTEAISISKHFSECKRDIHLRLRKLIGSRRRSKVLIIESKKDVRGASSLCSAIFNEEMTGCKCLWLDLDDFYGFEDFAIRLRLAVARTAGCTELRPNLIPNTPDGIRAKLEELIGGSRRNWVLFLNARDEPGSNAGFSSNRNHHWTRHDNLAFWNLIRTLTTKNAICSVILLRYQGNLPDAHAHMTFRLPSSCVDFSSRTVVDAAITWLRGMEKDEPDTAAIRFVYALTLFRQARYPAALITWAVIWLNNVSEDHDECRSRKAEEWLSKLAEQGVTQFKIGGFVWMHTEIRQSLKKRLEVEFHQLSARAEVHQSIADWYYKLYLSSNDPLAVFESIYHRYECARAAQRKPSVRALQEGAMREAVNLLKLAKNSILTIGHPESNRVSLLALRQSLQGSSLPFSSELNDLYDAIIFDITRENADFPTCLQMTRSGLSQGHEPAFRPAELNELEPELERAILLTGMQSYERADQAFASIADTIKLHVKEWTGVPAVRRLAQKWAYERKHVPGALRLGVRFLRRWMFLKILQSQGLHLATRERENMGECPLGS